MLIQISKQCLWCCHSDKVITRVHLINVEQHQVAAVSQNKSTAFDHESAYRLYCLHSTTLPVVLLSITFSITQPESWRTVHTCIIKTCFCYQAVRIIWYQLMYSDWYSMLHPSRK